jgi:hypothetical protein
VPRAASETRVDCGARESRGHGRGGGRPVDLSLSCSCQPFNTLRWYTVRVSDRTRLQKLFIPVNTPFTRGFWAKIPVLYESCAVGAILGDFGQLWAILGFSGLFLHKYAVYEGFLAIKYSLTVTISCKRVLSDTRTVYETIFYR